MKQYSFLLFLLITCFACQQNTSPLTAEIASKVLDLDGEFADVVLPQPQVKNSSTRKEYPFLLRTNFVFQRFSNFEQERNNQGKLVTYHVRQLKNEQLLFSSYEKNSALEMLLKADNTNNPIQAALLAMHPSDSIAMKLPYDYWQSIPKGFSEGDIMEIQIKMLLVEEGIEREKKSALASKKGRLYPEFIVDELLPLDRGNLDLLAAKIKRLQIKEGQGNTILNSSKVRLDFIGMLENGMVFRNTFKEKIPKEFDQGDSNMIQAWNIACEGMKEGGKYLFFAPASTAYGASGNRDKQIPENSDLIFYVEVLKVNND